MASASAFTKRLCMGGSPLRVRTHMHPISQCGKIRELGSRDAGIYDIRGECFARDGTVAWMPTQSATYFRNSAP